jgi:hypothetical protein
MNEEKWEYLVHRINQGDLDNVASILNKFGDEGWELVSVCLDISFYFKRWRIV